LRVRTRRANDILKGRRRYLFFVAATGRRGERVETKVGKEVRFGYRVRHRTQAHGGPSLMIDTALHRC
jgi:hypothetical protein